ncbi:unnamed protein product [Psylliodes chrysocephalus]|uniref:Selenoprotein S n=1 Tax=Psylliodes chrysocephalus TaxID=3402493 RepID=A0A9P0CCR2_9CUCU|nr:unnamed protein product [Psylliodes chrysocephala]
MDEEIEYPSHFSDTISTVVDIIANYGWYILISVVATLYLYEKYLKSRFRTYKSQKEEAEYSAKYHKNPDLLSARLLAQEKRTRELQEKYQRDAEEHKKKLEEREEKRKNELLEKYNDGGHTLGPSSSKSFKPEYNPLMGSGSSTNYKPQKRSACSKGGCG